MRKMTMYEIARTNENFFSKGAMRGFNSRIQMNQASHSQFNMFITSEKFDYNSQRLYTIRIALGDNSICSFSEFQMFGSLYYANKDLNKLKKIMKSIENEGGFLEQEILKNACYADYKEDLYILIATIDNEERKLKINTETMTYTF